MARLGDQVDVYCGRCKVERYHTVAAIGAGGRIERIVCGYCHTPRKYRDPAAAPPRKAAGVRATPRAPRMAEVADLATPARAFSTAETYGAGDVIQHSRYGRGRVVAVRGDRIDVKFIDGNERTFLHTPPPEDA